MAITIIFGVPRVGKTALLTSFALEYMSGIKARRDIKDCNKLIEPYNAGGFNYVLPSEHLVFSDYYIQDRRDKITSYEIDGFYLGLPNEQHNTLFLPPYSRIYLDEAQKFFNSRASTSLADFVSRFYELHGHFRLNITLAVQRPKLIDLNVRELAVQIIEVIDLKHYYEHGLLIGSEWTCNIFDNTAKAIQYIDSGKNGGFGDKCKFLYRGNIFKHYNSYGFMPLFFKDRYDKQFDLKVSSKCGKNLKDVKEFNDLHGYEVPETYFKIKGGGKKTKS